MNNELEKRYSFKHVLAMVIGIVIGSGIFFKTPKALSLVNGSMTQCLICIAVVGLIAIISSNIFAVLARKHVKCIGFIDYAEATMGHTFSYYVGWFMAEMYYPIIAGTLAHMTAGYTCLFLGLRPFGWERIVFGLIFILLAIFVNSISPKTAGKIQITTTALKLIPIILMAVVGSIVGLINGNGISIFTDTSAEALSESTGFFGAICCFSFIFEGWGIATSMNSELKNPQRDLPLALTIGTFFSVIIYLLYTYSMGATLTAEEIVAADYWLPQIAFSNLFHSNLVGTLIYVFIIISCLGTLNGVIFSCMRSFYALAIRNQGPNPTTVAQFNHKTKMPTKSCILGGIMAVFWYLQCSVLYYQGPLQLDRTGLPVWLLGWEADELVIMAMYALYIPIYAHIIKEMEDFNFVQRYLLPVLGICCSCFMFYCTWQSYGNDQLLYFLCTTLVVMLVGSFFYKHDRNLE